MKRFLLPILAMLATASPAAASTFDLGSLGSFQLFGNSYAAVFGSGTGSFTDYYTFNVGQSTNLGGQSVTVSFGTVNLSLSQVAFYQAGQSTAFAVDTSPSSFSLSNLSSGSYVMAITGALSGTGFLSTGVGSYAGSLTAAAAGRVASTPLPATWGMMLLGLGVLVFMGYRHQRGERASAQTPERQRPEIVPA